MLQKRRRPIPIVTSSARHRPPDPLAIEWSQTRHRAGRPVTIQAKIPIGQGKKETICISATEAGAKFLKDNLGYYARVCRSNAQAIQESLLWDFLVRWESNYTKRQFMMEAVNDTLVQDGPWIRAFAKRVSQPSSGVKREDRELLERILAAAKRAGRARTKFYSKTDRLLKWPLQAYLIELCLGGAQWWTEHKLKPPFKIVQAELDRSRSRDDGDRRGPTSLYKWYLGCEWETLMTGSPKHMPQAVQRLLPK
jgi:hypothetical protein